MTNTPNKDHPEQHLDMVREDFEAWWREWGLGGEEVQWEAYQAATQRSAERISELESGLAGIKSLLSRDPCAHANTAIQMIDAAIARATHKEGAQP